MCPHCETGLVLENEERQKSALIIGGLLIALSLALSIFDVISDFSAKFMFVMVVLVGIGYAQGWDKKQKTNAL